VVAAVDDVRETRLALSDPDATFLRPRTGLHHIVRPEARSTTLKLVPRS
jgi:hypothetical protein